METPIVEITPASPDQEWIIKRLLADNDLPSQDVSCHLEHFHVAVIRGEVVGAVGAELYGPVALLRSLVVSEPFRRQGVARQLYDCMESYTRARGVSALYLLTMSAAGFFRKIGFSEIGRETVPDKLKETQEFAVFCPSSATCMVKRLGQGKS